MTQQNNEFEKSAKEAGFLNHPIHGLIVRHSNGSWVGVSDKLEYLYQAAKADSEREIAELRAENKQIDAINASLQANINVLRDALMDIAKTNASTHGTTQMMLAHCIKSANEALASTPVQSLQAHDDKVIERVVTLLKYSAWDDGIIDMRVDDLIEDVQALKGK